MLVEFRESNASPNYDKAPLIDGLDVLSLPSWD